MKCEYFFGIALLGLALGAACGGSAANIAGDSGADSTSSSGGSGSGSGGTASSGGSSGGASSGGASSSGASSSGGRRDGGALTRTNDCPNCPGSQVCCLAPMGSNLQGTCAATAAACPSGAASIECGGASDCNGTQSCCISVASSGGPSSTSCQASCPSGSPPACGGMPSDNVDCDQSMTGAGWTCVPLAGTPQAVLGKCVPVEGGAPPGDGGGDAAVNDTGTPDADGGSPPQDAASDGG